jgi:hypothetical protein
VSLATAIDELLAFVPDKRPPECFVLRDELLKRFDELDRKVWVEACRSGHEGKLPRQAAAGNWDYYGKTNLPGRVYAGFRVAPAYIIRLWRNDLLALRDLAAPARGGDRDQKRARGDSKKASPGRPHVSTPDADQKMHEDWKTSGMTQKEFARERGLSWVEVEAACKRHRTRQSRIKKKRSARRT